MCTASVHLMWFVYISTFQRSGNGNFKAAFTQDFLNSNRSVGKK